MRIKRVRYREDGIGPRAGYQKRIGVIGAGNVFMGDDGIGPRVLDRLKSENLPPGVGIIDVGTNYVSVLHHLAKLDVAIIIDAADFWGKPGEIRDFGPEDVESLKTAGGFSNHEGDLLGMIRLSDRLCELPKDILIIGVQTASIEPAMELSRPLERRMSEIVDHIAKMIDRIVENDTANISRSGQA